MIYSLRLRDDEFKQITGLDEAIRIAEDLYKLECHVPNTIVTVADESNTVVASFTNRRIIGDFHKQKWTGRKNDTAEPVGEVTFDCTDYLLRMDYEDLIVVEDCDASSDNIGIEHVEWNDPYSVYLVEQICAFFGIDSFSDLTKDHFEFVKRRFNPHPARDVVVTLTLKLKLHIQAGVDLKTVIHNINPDISASTGVRSRGHRIAGWKVQEETGVVSEVSAVIDDPAYTAALLDCAEDISRCSVTKQSGVDALLAGCSRIYKLRELVKQARKPYLYQGGRKIRKGGA